MESQIYKININLQRKITSTEMKHSNLLVLLILAFLNEHYRKTNKGKNKKEKNRTKINEK